MRIFSLLCLLCVVGFASSARGQKVLVIADDDATGSGLVTTALTTAGMTVTQTAVPVWEYTGANPAPTGFDVIVLLAGTTNARTTDMPAGGQNAILTFVGAGGGLINTEWSAKNVGAGLWQTLAPLVLLSRSGGTIGNIDYTVAPGFANHPIWMGLPATFEFASATNVGTAVPGTGVVTLASSVAAGDAVVIRDVANAGRIVQLSTAGDSAVGTWSNANLQTLVVNSVSWASKSRVISPPTAFPNGPYMVNEGGVVQLQGACGDPNGLSTTLTWDFTGNGKFTDAQGPMPIFSAANLDGPQVIPIALKCTNTGGLSTVASTMVTVNPVAPTFTSTPVQKATEATLYTYTATVSDPGPNEMMTCSLLTNIVGMTVSTDCRVRWTPTFDQARAGTAPVTLQATATSGLMVTQSWTITVAFIDVDMDGLPDTWELMYFGNLLEGPGDDPDHDGRPNLKEYQDGTDPTKYDGPSAPVPITPVNGQNTSLAPPLTVMNAIEPHGDPLLYQFELYTDQALTQLIDVNIQVAEGGNGMTAYTPAVMLVEDTHYWWRARARDPYIAGAWTPVSTFFANAVHEAPTAPAIFAPLDGAKVKELHPTLQVSDAVSPDELALTYTFELYTDAQFTMLVESKGGIAETMGTTSYAVVATLQSYVHYWWRVKATDSLGLDGPWSDTGNFQIVPLNAPPSPPTITYPTDGSLVASLSPTVLMTGSTDPVNETLVYLCEVDVGMSFNTPAKQVSMNIPLDPVTTDGSWTIPTALMDTTNYCVHCRAVSPTTTSGWTQVCFLTDSYNHPPSVPVLQNPSDGGMAAGDVVRFTWVNSIDPEGDSIRYEIEVYTDAALTLRVSQGDGGDGPTGTTLSGLPGGGLWWRARAVDSRGAASAWSKPNHFNDTAVPGAAEPAPDAGCGCALGARRSESNPGWLAMLSVMFALVIRRRRARR